MKLECGREAERQKTQRLEENSQNRKLGKKNDLFCEWGDNSE